MIKESQNKFSAVEPLNSFFNSSDHQLWSLHFEASPIQMRSIGSHQDRFFVVLHPAKYIAPFGSSTSGSVARQRGGAHPPRSSFAIFASKNDRGYLPLRAF